MTFVNSPHRLSEYISILNSGGLIESADVGGAEAEKIVKYVSYNSADIEKDTLFICKGAHFSREYLEQALREGAFAYVSEKVYEIEGADQPRIIVNDMRKAMALIADFYYNSVWKNLTIAGVTGTKGKSTTVYFLKYIFDDYLRSKNKPESAILSSIDNYDGIIDEESHLTTQEALVLHKHFSNAVRSGIEFFSMEVSSQALKYDRTSGILFDVGCFLNIGEDHISAIEHSDFDDYLNSKLLLFDQCKTACVGLESDHAYDILNYARTHSPRIMTFGLTEAADVYGYNISVNQNGVAFKVKYDGCDREYLMAMRGRFNVRNALAAIAICYALGIPYDNIYNGLSIARVSGRMEVFGRRDGGPSVIVDYAHNKMSFEALFDSVKGEFPGRKISIVFGCPGYKALGRRRELAEVAGRYSERIFITEEDAGEEPLTQICEDIAAHVKETGCDYEIIPDRGEAIKKAIETADDNTVILITGKGRETRQKRGTEYIDVISDVEYVEELLK